MTVMHKSPSRERKQLRRDYETCSERRPGAGGCYADVIGDAAAAAVTSGELTVGTRRCPGWHSSPGGLARALIQSAGSSLGIPFRSCGS